MVSFCPNCFCQKYLPTDEKHLSTVRNNIYSPELTQRDVRNRTHPWGINPVSYLEELRQQSRINKFITVKESITSMARSSISSIKEREQENLNQITDTLQQLKTTRKTLSELETSDVESATHYGRDLMLITTDILLRVVKQIGQTNVQTPTFESIIAYIRNLIHSRSAHMRQTIPGPLLIAWYDLSQLISSMQNEPELRITIRKAKQLLDTAHDTAAWAFKHLSTELSNAADIGFVDRNSTPYTYE